MDSNLLDEPTGIPKQRTSDIRGPARRARESAQQLKLDTTSNNGSIFGGTAVTTGRRRNADDLPLRSPSPRKVKETVAFSPGPGHPPAHGRKVSIELPPPKRRHVGSTSPSRLTPSLVITSPDDAPCAQNVASSASAKVDDRDAALSVTAKIQRLSSSSFGPFKQKPGVPFQFLKHLCTEQEITIRIATELLPPEDMFKLFCLEPAFHYLVLSHYENFILNSLRIWSPLVPKPKGPDRSTELPQLMPYSMYHRFCHRDPTRRPIKIVPIPEPGLSPGLSPAEQRTSTARLSVPTPVATIFRAAGLVSPGANHKDQGAEATPLLSPNNEFFLSAPQTSSVSRLVPTFRYLFFARHRVRTIHSILRTLLFTHEFRLPRMMVVTLAKIWLVMDIPINGGRIALFNGPFFTDDDLHRASLFFMKLDMAFTDPFYGRGETALRKMMLAQRSLSVLDLVLRRKALTSQLALTRMFLRWKFQPTGEERESGLRVLGVPVEECGILETEGWGKKWIQNGFSWTQVKEVEKSQVKGAEKGGAAKFEAKERSRRSPAPPPELGVQTPPPTARTTNQSRRQAQPQSSASNAGLTFHTPAGSGPNNDRANLIQLSRAAQLVEARLAPQSAPLPGRQQAATSTSPTARSHRPPSIPTSLVLPTPPLSTPAPTTTSNREVLLRPDELVIRAGIRRRLGLERQTRNMMLYGYYHETTLRPYAPIPTPKWWANERRATGEIDAPDPDEVQGGEEAEIKGPLGGESWKDMAEDIEKLRASTVGAKR